MAHVKILRKGTIPFKFIAIFLAIAIFVGIILPTILRNRQLSFGKLRTAQAAVYGLPLPTKLLPLSKDYSYPLLKGLRFSPKNPLNIEFIVDTSSKDNVSREEASRLIRYFLAGLTLPQGELWVNLSPHEEDRVASGNLALTDLGKDMLGQDYCLKQLVSSLTYPESETGKEYWQQVYQQLADQFGTSDMPINTYNKVWIMPEKSVVYEKANTAFILEASLKVMHQRDYVAVQQNSLREGTVPIFSAKKMGQSPDQIDQITSQIFNETILPKINQEVNHGENFATLRQIYHALVLAVWFRKKFKDSFYKDYIDQGKISGIGLEDKGAKEKIYNLYVEAYKKGVYNYVRRDYDPATNKKLNRRYYSGGVLFDKKVEDFQQVVTELPKGVSIARDIGDLVGLGSDIHKGAKNLPGEKSRKKEQTTQHIEQVSGRKITDYGVVGSESLSEEEAVKIERSVAWLETLDNLVIRLSSFNQLEIIGGVSTISALARAGLISKDDIEDIPMLDILINKLNGLIPSTKKQVLLALEALIEAGLITEDDMKNNSLLSKLIIASKSQYTDVEDAAVRVIEALIRAGSISRDEVKDELPADLPIDLLASKVTDSYWYEQQVITETVAEIGSIKSNEVKSRFPMDTLVSDIIDSSWQVRDAAIAKIKTLAEAGLIAEDDIKNEPLLSNLITNLTSLDQHVPEMSAGLMKALIETGLISRDEVRSRLPINTFIGDLANSNRQKQNSAARAVNALKESGLISEEDIKGFSYKELKDAYLAICGKKLDNIFVNSFIRLLKELKDDPQALKRASEYFTPEFEWIYRFAREAGDQDRFYSQLAKMITDGVSPDQALEALEDEMQLVLLSRVRMSDADSAMNDSRYFFKFAQYLRKKERDISIELMRQAFRLYAIDFSDGGDSPANYNTYSEAALSDNQPPKLEVLPSELPQKQARQLKEFSKLDSLDGFLEGAVLLRAQGRTLVYKTREGKILCVKVLKDKENPNDLFYEHQLIEYIYQHKGNLGLKGQYPKALLVNGQRVNRVASLSEGALAALNGQASKEGEALTPDHRYKHYTLMAYELDNEDYLTYLNDSELDIEQFKGALLTSIHDLFVLGRHGLLHTDLIELFHNLGQNRRFQWMIAIIQQVMSRSGTGRLHAWPSSVKYPNSRISGVADFANVFNLEDIANPSNKDVPDILHSLQRFGPSASNFYLASYLGDYLFASTLMIGSYLRETNQLDIDSIESINQLQSIMKEMFEQAYTSFSGRQASGRTIDLINWERLAKQMAYFMAEGDEYADDLIKNSIRSELYEVNPDYSESYEGSRGFKTMEKDGKRGYYFDDVNPDLGPVNGPLPLQELVKALYVVTADMIVDFQDKGDKVKEVDTPSANSVGGIDVTQDSFNLETVGEGLDEDYGRTQGPPLRIIDGDFDTLTFEITFMGDISPYEFIDDLAVNSWK
ncbi:MAG: hypothetical protein GY858_00365 [Candidatus Omnitrophica bacterium]|nr:hypothetical protein [Candidatus Omnitrophota bacterium]